MVRPGACRPSLAPPRGSSATPIRTNRFSTCGLSDAGGPSNLAATARGALFASFAGLACPRGDRTLRVLSHGESADAWSWRAHCVSHGRQHPPRSASAADCDWLVGRRRVRRSRRRIIASILFGVTRSVVTFTPYCLSCSGTALLACYIQARARRALRSARGAQERNDRAGASDDRDGQFERSPVPTSHRPTRIRNRTPVPPRSCRPRPVRSRRPEDPEYAYAARPRRPRPTGRLLPRRRRPPATRHGASASTLRDLAIPISFSPPAPVRDDADPAQWHSVSRSARWASPSPSTDPELE